MKTSIIIPMWNEELWVKNAYDKIKQKIQDYKLDAQIVFAVDGCTDNTVEIIKELQTKDPFLLLFDYPNKLGRGLALKKAFSRLDTTYIVYMDSDLATDLKHLPQIIKHLDDGADIVTGSRLMKGAKCVRSQKRNLFSRVYNFAARFLFRSKIYDHQCGFKGFNRLRIMNVLSDVRSNGWFWDTELLLRGQKAGLNIIEFPVIWKDRQSEESKVNVLKDARNMGFELIQLRLTLFPEIFTQMITFAAVGISNTLVTLLTLILLEISIGRGVYGYYLSYIVGIINSFILNRKFTFKEKEVSKRTLNQFVGFFGVALIAMIVYSETAKFLEVGLGIFYLIAALMSTMLAFLFTFIVSKFTIFRKNQETES